MVVREASLYERKTLMQGDEGFVVDEKGVQVCSCGWRIKGDAFVVHSLVNVGPEEALASMAQALRQKAKSRGFKALQFCVEPHSPALLRLVESGRARVTEIWLEMNV